LAKASGVASWPKVTVIVPCKGEDHELQKNLESIVNQEPPAHEIIFVTAAKDDPAKKILEELRSRHPTPHIHNLAAGVSSERGEKVNNLLVAVEHSDPASEIFVFADSDARPDTHWLRRLVAPLCSSNSPGATTGYRWYLPEPRNAASILRSAWNAGIATLLGPHRNNFCWGGSTAIRRETFDQIRVRDYWKHSISDDYSMTQALRDAKQHIEFVPCCLLPSHGPTRWREVLEWSTRQLIITKVYSSKLWRLALISQTIFALTIILGVALLFFNRRSPSSLPKIPSMVSVMGLLAAIFLMGFIRGFYRWLSIREILSDHRSNLNRFAPAYIFLPPVISLFSTFILWSSAFTHRVKWRDRTYELISSREMKVVE
jgi:ceramide glucosyltransferase